MNDATALDPLDQDVTDLARLLRKLNDTAP